MGQFDHVAFQVGNMDAAIQFYVEKLGFTLSSRAVNQEEQEEFVFVTLGDLRLELTTVPLRADYITLTLILLKT